MKIAAAYIRVSTDDQIEYSPESQLKAIRDYAKRNDYILPDDFIFIDEGITGKTTKKRSEFQRMIGTAKITPKPFDAILLWKFSRFARNREDSVVYKSMLRKQLGIDVISISENLGDDKMSILFEAMIEAMDEYYSINLAEEVKRGMTEKARRGEPLSVPPFGYSMKDGSLTPQSEEAIIVEMIFKEFINGMGKLAIAKKANAMGAVTHRGNAFENRTVDYILHNPVYIGKIRWNPSGRTNRDFYSKELIISQGTHSPIISEKLWEQAQERLKTTNRNKKRYVREASSPSHIFQGLIKCSNCGSTLIYSGKGLQCHLYAKGRCEVSHYISIAKIEKLVIENIQNDFKNGNINISPKHREEVNRNEFVLKQISREKEKLARVKEAFEKGIDSIEEYSENKARIQNKISELTTQLASSSDASSNSKEVRQAFISKYKAVVVTLTDPNSSIAEKNTILRMFVDEIVFNKSAASVHITYSL